MGHEEEKSLARWLGLNEGIFDGSDVFCCFPQFLFIEITRRSGIPQKFDLAIREFVFLQNFRKSFFVHFMPPVRLKFCK